MDDNSKPMRAAMPHITEFIDALRAAGMLDDDTLRSSLRAGTFYASENGYEVGVRQTVVAVQPTLSMEAEGRLLDREWAESQEAKP